MIRDNCFVRLLAFFTYIVLFDSLLSSSSFFAVCELAMSTFITYVFSLLLFPLCPFFHSNVICVTHMKIVYPSSGHYLSFLISCSAYGSEVGSVGIKLIPTGGLYVTGGLTPKNINWIKGKDSHFMTAYLDKGRVSPILDNVPLLAVMVEDLGVRGATKNAQIVRSYFSLSRRTHTHTLCNFLILNLESLLCCKLFNLISILLVSSSFQYVGRNSKNGRLERLQ